MFNTVDAAMYYPHTGRVYFFKGPHYISYRFGSGIVIQSGSERRTIGVSGWWTFPDEFRRDLDAALYYPPNGHAYFFKGAQYIKYRPGDGVVLTSDGRLIRTIADRWHFPAPFDSGIDAALFHPGNRHAYFFKQGEYIKYNPETESVVLHRGNPIRTIGATGWKSFPGSFQGGIDAAMDYPSRDKLYFFRGRDYIRWEIGAGVDKHYPRRFGLLHRDNGGWPGLSHVIAGPMVGPVTHRTARIWIWMTSSGSADSLEITLNGSRVGYRAVDPVDAKIRTAVDRINSGSAIRILELDDLSPATNYTARIMFAAQELDVVSFKTAPAPSSTGKVTIAFGSCADMSKDERAVPTFEAMKNHGPDLALFCGDNCYYVNDKGTTSLPGEPNDRPRDWESTKRMLIRQVEARNHPQFRRLSRSIPLYSTWDDHDFGYNNAQGSDLTDYWVGRDVASAVFRAMWPNPYLASRIDRSILHSFRWGPVEVFMTDSRFIRKVENPRPDNNNNFIWGLEQTEWLQEGLAASSAPLKIVVVSGQFLFNQTGEDGHRTDAPTERAAVLNTIANIPGRVVFLSGDMHYSELVRFPPGSGAATTLEFTNSPIRRNSLSGAVDNEVTQGCRIWAGQHNGFGTVTVDIRSNNEKTGVIGTVTLEAWAVEEDDGGVVSRRLLTSENDRNCRSIWDLADGTVT